MMFQRFLLFGALAASALAQSAHTDAKSGISFSQFSLPDKITFGIALPADAKTDFIAQIVSKNDERPKYFPNR
jgi:hypothetical protein